MSRVLREGEEEKQEEEEVSGGPSKSNGRLALEQLRTTHTKFKIKVN